MMPFNHWSFFRLGIELIWFELSSVGLY